MPGTDLTAFAAELRVTGVKCDAAARSELMSQLESALADAVRPLTAEVRTGLVEYMPTRYAGVLGADLSLTATERKSGSTVSSLITAHTMRKRRQIRRLDRTGRLNHPLWGDKQHWYGQSARVKAGFFTRPLQRAKRQIRKAMTDALARTADEVAG